MSRNGISHEVTRPYLHSERFSDFTIICRGARFSAHRVFLCPQSKWFDRCCSGDFLESNSREVELHGDLLTAVECMISFFYTGDYSDFSVIGSDFKHFEELHAHVYATADKYEIPRLKDLALKKLRAKLFSQNKQGMRAAAKAVFEDVLLRDTDHVLQDAVLGVWMASDMNASDHGFMLSALTEMPQFASELTLRLLADRKRSLATMTLTRPEAIAAVKNQETIQSIVVSSVKANVEIQTAKLEAIIAQKDAEIAKLQLAR
ncbi:hypothetical protein DOTSEDRAFT_28812 [Dothistroma septosporum NZE10]|uniref:BTB domain-containing protein n=1 Tax=Dothistroma septosporum (strain NZE10 / CBS 128990) TaxID=675120 RepID=M2XJR2_DOTSN|nr:hypothetical protein DOTSEDRAFT_28812 [Dothistroma septosporum NZE10]